MRVGLRLRFWAALSFRVLGGLPWQPGLAKLAWLAWLDLGGLARPGLAGLVWLAWLPWLSLAQPGLAPLL